MGKFGWSLVIAITAGTAVLVPAQDGPTQAELLAAGQNTSEWLLPTHDYGAQRFVPGTSLNVQNAANLQPVCLYQVGEAGSFQVNPLVYQGLLYLATPQRTIALDATDCRPVWEHVYQNQGPTGAAAQRGLAIKDGLVLRGTPDGWLLALHAKTGAVVWNVPAAAAPGESIPTAPLVFENLVIVGPASTDRGWVAAFDLRTGALVWRFYVIPAPGEPGAETWSDPAALADGRAGGGSVWTGMTLDVERGALHVPVSGPAPAFSNAVRGGSNLYTSSVVVLNVRTGQLLWHYQLLPGNVLGMDTTSAGPLFTTNIDGARRELAAAIGKDGLLHVIDRATHALVYKVPVSAQLNHDAAPTPEGIRVCSGYLGGQQWNGPAYNPDTNLLYVASVEWCSTYYADATLPAGGRQVMDPIGEARGRLTAINASTGEIAWTYDSPQPMLAAVTTTAGRVLLTGELTGDLVAFDAGTGRELYRFNTGGAIGGGVIAYEQDGVSYVAVMSGNQSPLWGSRGSATVVLFTIG